MAEEGWNTNWLLTGEGPERLDQLVGADKSQPVSGEALMVATELADEALRGLWLPKHRYFDLVALIYDGVTQGLPFAEIIDFARPAAGKLAKERESDDRAQGLDEADSSGAGRGGTKAGNR